MLLLAVASNRLMVRNLSLCFLGGAVGAVPNRLFVWFMGVTGINSALGLKIQPAFTWPWLENALIWGGFFGFVFYLFMNAVNRRPFLTGLLVSFLPSLNMLFYVMPKMMGVGVAGMQLGTLTPVFVLVANGFWGVAAAYWIQSGME